MKTKYFLFTLLVLLLIGTVTGRAQSTFDEYMAAGVEAHDKGQYPEAINLYKKALKLHPSSMNVYYEIGLSYAAQKEYDKAIKSFQKAEKATADVLNKQILYSSWGSTLDDNGQEEEAIKVMDKGLEIGPEAILLYNKGVTCFRMGRVDEAEECFILALQEKAFHANSLRLLADIQEDKRHITDAFLLRCCYLLVVSDKQYDPSVLEKVANAGKTDKKDTINITLSENTLKNKGFNLELLTSFMLQAKTDTDILEDQKFGQQYLNLKTRLPLMTNILKQQGTDGLALDICRKRYAFLLRDICQNGYIDVYAAIATYMADTASQLWINVNTERVDSFYKWLNDNKYVKETQL